MELIKGTCLVLAVGLAFLAIWFAGWWAITLIDNEYFRYMALTVFCVGLFFIANYGD